MVWDTTSNSVNEACWDQQSRKDIWRLWQGTLLPEAQEGRRRLKAGLNAPKYVNLCMQPFDGSKKHPGACIGEQTVQPIKKGTLLPEAHLQGTAGQEPA